MTSRSLTFPTEPARLSYFREPSGEPRVDRRWQRVVAAGNKALLDFRWVGQCISSYCGNRPIFVLHPEGLLHDSLGYAGALLMEVDISEDPDRPDIRRVRTCFQCGSNERLMERVRTATREALEADPDVDLGFLQWPDDTVLTKAKSNGSSSVRSMVTV